MCGAKALQQELSSTMVQKSSTKKVSARQTALERQDLSHMYLAHHELESEFVMIIIFVTVVIIISKKV